MQPRRPAEPPQTIPDAPPCTLRLYVSGSTPRSLTAVATVKAICEAHLPGRYRLEVVDVYQQPRRASEADVVLTPTLLRLFPLPPSRLMPLPQDAERLLRFILPSHTPETEP